MSQPAGNYWAEGDPPNTTRYWNGQTWEGGPIPVASQIPAAQSFAGPLTHSYQEDSQATMALMASLVGFMVCAIGLPIGWVMGKREMAAIDAGRRDPSKRTDAKVAYYVGMVGTIIYGIAIIGLAILFAGLALAA